jgi:hypothetical protein
VLTDAEWLLLGVGLGTVATVTTFLAWAVFGVKRHDRYHRFLRRLEAEAAHDDEPPGSY